MEIDVNRCYLLFDPCSGRGAAAIATPKEIIEVARTLNGKRMCLQSAISLIEEAVPLGWRSKVKAALLNEVAGMITLELKPLVEDFPEHHWLVIRFKNEQ